MSDCDIDDLASRLNGVGISKRKFKTQVQQECRFKCITCGQEKNSKNALRNHIRKHKHRYSLKRLKERRGYLMSKDDLTREEEEELTKLNICHALLIDMKERGF
ncbi:hypothetical protein PROFUN_04905 [Planoprotostelium fungivorum]|uniref:C2H2-type domain-containing protein n=1 Tax=Planoprotostelium fungivorum TaxID=1890364 RepID=A0A2P6NF60_9EUKA|nr:hypothetical protein PROFUN_04905 [Planoprotostelium fungivorum]